MKNMRRFNKNDSSLNRPRFYGLLFATFAFIACGTLSPAFAQTPRPHLLYDATTPPGVMGQSAVMRAPDVPGYFQPVEIRAPEGVRVSFIQSGLADEATPAPTKAGLLIGQVYRFRLTHIPLQVGAELYPTIELVDRLHPPEGQEVRYPIVVELNEDDLRLAADGLLVTRVVYLEDPQAAAPSRGDLGGQNWFDVGPDRDPLATADAMGRPMAIVRLGGRTPSRTNGMIDPDFTFGEPPFVRYPSESLLDQATPASGQIMIPALPVSRSRTLDAEERQFAPSAPLPPATWGPAGARAAEVLGRPNM